MVHRARLLREGQVQGVPGFVPPRCEIERRTQFGRHEKRRVRVCVDHHDRRRARTQLEGKARSSMYARSRSYSVLPGQNRHEHVVHPALIDMPGGESR